MTIWLWIIGIAAFVWPVIVAYHFEKESNRAVEDSFKRYGKMHGTMEDRTAEKISDLQKLVEKQDALITALWQNSFGFYREDSYSEAELRAYLGVKPDWHPFTREWGRPVVYLVRYEPYPWGTRAEHLDFSE